MHPAMATPSNCMTPVGINRAEPCPYLHGGETGFSPVSACSPVSRMGFDKQETDISEPRWSCQCRPSQNTPIIYAANFSIGQVYQRGSFSRACPKPNWAWFSQQGLGEYHNKGSSMCLVWHVLLSRRCGIGLHWAVFRVWLLAGFRPAF